MTRFERTVTPAHCVAAILVTGYLAVLSANLPGQMSYDSVFALYQIRHHLPLTFDPPIENVLWGFFDRILPGPALFVTANVLLFFASLLSFLRLRKRVTWAAALVALFIVSCPLVLVSQAIVWHDVLFANLSIAGFTALAWAAKVWERRRFRTFALAVSIVILSFAALSRQNGVICFVVGLVGVFAIGLTVDNKTALRIGLTTSLCAVAFLVATNVVLSVQHANASYGSGVEDVQEFDIAGVAAVDPHVDLSLLDRGNPAIDTMIRKQAQSFSPQRLAFLQQNSPQLWNYLQAEPPDVISAEWWSILIHDPVAYVHHRLRVFRWSFLTPDVTRCLPVFVGVGGDPKMAQDLGLTYGVRAQDQALYMYSSRFFQTPEFSHAFYATISIVVIALLFLRGQPSDIAMIAMLAGGLLVTASYLIIGISCDFRFLYFLDVSALAGLLYAAIDPPVFMRRAT